MNGSDMKDPVGELAASIREYSKVQLEIVKLEAVSVFSLQAARVGMTLLLFVITSVFFLLLSLAGGFFLGQWLNNTALGFLAIAGICLLKLILLFVFRDSVFIRPVRNKIINALLNKSADQ